MANKSPFILGYGHGLNNKPRANPYLEYSAMWKSYNKGYDTGKKARTA